MEVYHPECRCLAMTIFFLHSCKGLWQLKSRSKNNIQINKCKYAYVLKVGNYHSNGAQICNICTPF
jgi:hypothetical protein